MPSFWKQALKNTGSVAVVGFLFASVIGQLFQKHVAALFGSDRLFYLTVLLLALLFSALIFAIKYRQKTAEHPSSVHNRADITKSTVNGDVVVGTKNSYDDKQHE